MSFPKWSDVLGLVATAGVAEFINNSERGKGYGIFFSVIWIFIMCTYFILDMASFEFIQYDDCTDLSYLFWCPFEGPYALSSAWKRMQVANQKGSYVPIGMKTLASCCHVSLCSAVVQVKKAQFLHQGTDATAAWPGERWKKGQNPFASRCCTAWEPQLSLRASWCEEPGMWKMEKIKASQKSAKVEVCHGSLMWECN